VVRRDSRDPFTILYAGSFHSRSWDQIVAITDYFGTERRWCSPRLSS